MIDISLEQIHQYLTVYYRTDRVVAQHHPPSVIEGTVHLSVNQNLVENVGKGSISLQL